MSLKSFSVLLFKAYWRQLGKFSVPISWLLYCYFPHAPSHASPRGYISFYNTSREDTLILLDESHVSKMLATYVSVGSLTAVTIDVMTPVVKEPWIVNLPFHDSLYCCGRHAFKIPARGESMSRPEQNAAVNNGIVLLLRTTIKKITLTFHRSFRECLISSNGSTQTAGRFKEVGEEDITILRGMTLFGIIKQMQHLCGVASMIVSPSGAFSPSGDKAPSGDTIMLATPQRFCICLMLPPLVCHVCFIIPNKPHNHGEISMNTTQHIKALPIAVAHTIGRKA